MEDKEIDSAYNNYDKFYVHWMTVEKGLHYVKIRTGYQYLNTYNVYYAKLKPVKQSIFTTFVENDCDNLSKINPFLIEKIN